MSAILVDRSARLRMLFSGDKAKESLGGLVTNDVVALTPGQGHRAVALTPKGRVIAMVRVFDRGADLLVDCEPASADGFVGMIRKFVNPRTAKYTVITEQTVCLGVYGANATKLLAPLLGASHETFDLLAPLALWRNEDVDVVRSDDLSVPGLDVIAAPARVAELRAALEAQGVREASAERLETLSVERGLPRFGIEMDGETIPQEANLDAHGAISFTKGCYTGQEVVARIHFRGHVNRHLRWLRATAPLPRGAQVVDADGKEVGEVRSSVQSPERGALAIAMLRREVVPGSAVQVRDGDRMVAAQVEAIA
ncbi:MAG TPA: glycine cleavage T C-terminal barrel domain-containing protein [Gemmatimonadaceae bacterium]|nr:glycine cleavage T C-terminal barrel domain-containing protein [Gemmatimonadaceae bacterium]HRQ77196.1 glycine cleavage T C-terminal barrel domain-containing protein [Gemmatimonadaceae bacterium]